MVKIEGFSRRAANNSSVQESPGSCSVSRWMNALAIDAAISPLAAGTAAINTRVLVSRSSGDIQVSDALSTNPHRNSEVSPLDNSLSTCARRPCPTASSGTSPALSIQSSPAARAARTQVECSISAIAVWKKDDGSHVWLLATNRTPSTLAKKRGKRAKRLLRNSAAFV